MNRGIVAIESNKITFYKDLKYMFLGEMIQ